MSSTCKLNAMYISVCLGFSECCNRNDSTHFCSDSTILKGRRCFAAFATAVAFRSRRLGVTVTLPEEKGNSAQSYF